MRVLFACDAGPEAGGGHLMRCLTLARALEAEGAACAFLAHPDAAALLDAYAPDMPRRPADSAEPARLVAAVRAAPDFDAVVFDHYGLDADDHRDAAGDRTILVIDDLADRPLGADLILDAGPDRRPEDYAGLAPPGAVLLLGPNYAPVRPEFAAARPTAMSRRFGQAGRILVSLGLGDLNGVTGRVVEILAPMTTDLQIDIVLSAAAPSLSKVKAVALAYPQLRLHIDSRDMAGLMAAADIAVGAGGSSSWERCVLGLPTILLILAENQRPAAQALETAGAVLALEVGGREFEGAFEEDLWRLFEDDQLRAGMAIAASQVCDGLGAARSAQALVALLRQTGADRQG